MYLICSKKLAGDGVLISLMIFFSMIISLAISGILAFVSKDFIDGVRNVRNKYKIMFE